MYWFLIIVPLAFIFAFCYESSKYGDFIESCFKGVSWAFGGAIIAFFAGLIAPAWMDKEPVGGESFPIHSLEDGTNTQGRFTLGSGYINERIAYYYYYKSGPNSFKQSYVTGDVTITESSDSDPMVKTRYCGYKDSGWALFETRDSHATTCGHEIIVPEGTIVKQITLDTSAS